MSLLAAGRKDKAMEVFKFNKLQHPDETFWTYLGLARGYTAIGDKPTPFATGRSPSGAFRQVSKGISPRSRKHWRRSSRDKTQRRGGERVPFLTFWLAIAVRAIFSSSPPPSMRRPSTTAS
jgi:hypothetical protein